MALCRGIHSQVYLCRYILTGIYSQVYIYKDIRASIYSYAYIILSKKANAESFDCRVPTTGRQAAGVAPQKRYQT
jgi:hypothetical protein